MGIELLWLALFALTVLALAQKDPPSSSIDWDEKTCECSDCLDQFYEFEEDDDISESEVP